jgi:hypothetical protein
MDNKTKLLLALEQVQRIDKLMEGNVCIRRHLIPIHTELNRQLSKERNEKEID